MIVKSRYLAQVGLGSSNQTKTKSMKLPKVLQCIMASLELPWTGEAPFLVLRTGDRLVATTRLPLLFASLRLQKNRNTFLVTTSTEQLRLQSHQLWIRFRGLRSPQRAYLWPKGQFAHAFQVECPLEAKGCHITSGSWWTTRKLTL